MCWMSHCVRYCLSHNSVLRLPRVCEHGATVICSVALFHAELHDVEEAPTDLPTLLRILCDASEFDELPVHHYEMKLHLAKCFP